MPVRFIVNVRKTSPGCDRSYILHFSVKGNAYSACGPTRTLVVLCCDFCAGWCFGQCFQCCHGSLLGNIYCAPVEMPCPFSSFKFAFSARAWRCRAILGSKFALVECSDVVLNVMCAGAIYFVVFDVVPFLFWRIPIFFHRACAVYRECLENVGQIIHFTV